MAEKGADILVINANELLTMKGAIPRVKQGMRDIGIIKNGAVAMKNGKILAVGRTPALKSRYEKGAGNVIDARGKVVMPGFVDCHTHMVFAGSRENELEMKLKGMSYSEIARQGGGILKTVKATRAATLDQLVDSSRRKLDAMLRFGTTTVEVKSGYGLNLEDEAKMLRAIEELNGSQPVEMVPTFMGAHALPPEFEDYEAYTDELVGSILPSIKRENIAEFCDVFCDRGYFTNEQTRRILEKAKALGMGTKIHVDELAGTGGAELAAEMGAVSAEHLIHSSEKGLRMMAQKGCVGVLLPASSYSMMKHEYVNAMRMIEIGVPVALGTDLSPNSWTESMQFVISLACYKLRMLPAEAIAASTINAAHAVRRDGSIGSLEPGKQADIIILDAPNHAHVPYHFGLNLVDKVIKKGKIAV